ncbi:unnamed protein product [Hanseniaspora opuntiae]
MHLWPTYTSQNFRIPESLEDGDNDILDIVGIQSINTFLILTKERVLVYQGKPFAPIFIYTRSKESISQFGYNKKILYNEPLNKISGVNDSDVSVIDLNDSSIFYISTDKNCVLILELRTLHNWSNNMSAYGIAPILNTESIANQIEYIEKVDVASKNQHNSVGKNTKTHTGMKRDSLFYMEINNDKKDNIDDDLFTVFDIKTNGKILQNGFINEKGKDLVQIMKEMFFIRSSFYRPNKKNRRKVNKNSIIDNTNDEAHQEEASNMVDDMPLKRCNIKLKTVLKFDDDILDFQVFTKYNDAQERQEIIYLLYETELSIITLKSDYTLESNHKISGFNNLMMAFNGTDMFVVNYGKQDDCIVINRIDKKNNVIYTKDLFISGLKEKQLRLVGISNFKERYLVLTFDKMILYYDTFLNTIYSEIKLLKTTGILSELQRDQYIKMKTYDRELLTLLKQNGIFQVYTRWGNLQTEMNLSKLFTGNSIKNYTAFAFLDNFLVSGAGDGHLQIIDFYKVYESNTFNERANADFSLFDSATNKITSFLDLESKRDFFLPTNSINNIVSDIKYNGSKKFCLINIPNKNIVLLKEFDFIDDGSDYDGWMVFDNMKVLGMDWIGDRHILLDMIDLDNTYNGRSIVCLDINKIVKSKSYKTRVVHLLEMKIWTYNIVNNDEVLYWGCNTYEQMLEFIKETNSDKDVPYSMYKLGEINILLKKSECSVFETIDILVEKETFGVRSFARNKFDLSKLSDVLICYEKNVKWACHKKKGTLLILTGDDELHKVVETASGSVEYEIVFTKVENIIECFNGKLTLVRENEMLIYDLDQLIGDNIDKTKQTILQQSLMNLGFQYPLLIKPSFDEFLSLAVEYFKHDNVINGFRLRSSTNLVLDLILNALSNNNKYSPSEVKEIYSKSENYHFCLEKMITEIIMEKMEHGLAENQFKLSLLLEESLEDKLTIIGNSLRKVDLSQVESMLMFLKYKNIDGLIEEVFKVENVHIRAMLISKLIIVKFNIEGKTDESLLSKCVSLLLNDITTNDSENEIQEDYAVVEEMSVYVEKVNGNMDTLVNLINGL